MGSRININPSLASPLDPVEAAKRLAAYTAVDKHIRPKDKVGHDTWFVNCAIKPRQIIGIGSGADNSLHSTKLSYRYMQAPQCHTL
jgi:hypothetical protein